MLYRKIHKGIGEIALALLTAAMCAVVWGAVSCTGDEADDDDNDDTDTSGGSDTDEGGFDAADFNGLWKFVSYTAQGATYTSDGEPRLVGDALFTSSGTGSGVLDARVMVTEQGVMGGSDIQTIAIDCQVEENRWIFDEDGVIRVMDAVLEGDTLTFTWDKTAPENAGEPDPNAPSPIVLKKVEQIESVLAGNWELVSLEFEQKTIIAGQCTASDSDTWEIIEATLTISDRLILEEEYTKRSYADAACTISNGDSGMTIRAYIDEKVGQADFWFLIEDEPNTWFSFALTQTEDTMTWTKTDCLPQPNCEDGFISATIKQL